MALIPNVDTTDPLTSQFCRHFILDDHIIMCIIDVPKKMPEQNPLQHPQHCDVYVILRDATGKYVWKTNPLFYEREEALNPVYDNAPSQNITKEPVFKDRYEQGIHQELYADLLGYLNSLRSDRIFPGGLMSHSDSYVASEKAHLSGTSFNLNVDVKYKLPEYKAPHDSALKFHSGRVLLSNLGFAHPDTYGRLVPLDSRPGLQASLKNLDTSVERSVLSVGVVLIQQLPKKPFEFLSDEGAGPQDYQDFLTSLGWAVNLWDHTGYRGPLVPASTGDYAPYFADHATEVIFPVANWIPNDDNFEATVSKKRKVLAAGPVLVIWSNAGEYEAPVTQREFLHIVIHPLRSGLYRIRLVTRENRPLPVGPLADNMKLSCSDLGPLVRMTAIAATRYLQPETAILAPATIRKNRIEELAKQFQRPMAFDDWMMNLLSTRLPPDLNSPAPAPAAATGMAAISKIAVEQVEGFSAPLAPQTLAPAGTPLSLSPSGSSLPSNAVNATPATAPVSMTASASIPVNNTPSGQTSSHLGSSPVAGSGSPNQTHVSPLQAAAAAKLPSPAPLNTSSPGAYHPGLQRQASISSGSVNTLAVPGTTSGTGSVAPRTSAPPSPRSNSDGSADDPNRARQMSASEGSESGEHSGTPSRPVPPHVTAGQGSPTSDHSPGSDHPSSGGPPIPGNYKSPMNRPMPNVTNPPVHMATGTGTGTGPTPSSPSTTPYGSHGSSSSGVASAVNQPSTAARKPSSGFGFWKKDKDKEKKTEEKKDPKKK